MVLKGANSGNHRRERACQRPKVASSAGEVVRGFLLRMGKIKVRATSGWRWWFSRMDITRADEGGSLRPRSRCPVQMLAVPAGTFLANGGDLGGQVPVLPVLGYHSGLEVSGALPRGVSCFKLGSLQHQSCPANRREPDNQFRPVLPGTLSNAINTTEGFSMPYLYPQEHPQQLLEGRRVVVPQGPR
jgi:hypothetical protein